jgi:GntR family transcriptional regulator/MocR family aminotransferase
MVVPEALIETFSAAKYYTDVRSSYLEQVALSQFIQKGHYARHVRKVRKACYERQQALIKTIDEHLSDVLSVQPTDSGIHAVCWLKGERTEQEFIDQCSALNLAVQPLSRYCQLPNKKAAVLFGYAAHTPNEIIENIKKIAQYLQEK